MPRAAQWTATEADLLARPRGGISLPSRRSCKRYQRRVYGTALRIVRRHDLADDVTQEAFLRAHRALARFDLGRPFGPWICRIAANLAINHVRSPEAREEALPEGAADDARRRGRGPLDAVLEDEARERAGGGAGAAARRAARGLRAARLRGPFLQGDRGGAGPLGGHGDEPAVPGAGEAARAPWPLPGARAATRAGGASR